MNFEWDEAKRKTNLSKYQNYTIENSQTNWERIKMMEDKEIDLTDIPEITEEQLEKATLRVGGKPVAKGKVRVNMYLDSEVVEYFKAQAGNRGYQTLINETLKESMRGDKIEAIVRQVIREELNNAK
jgi:uncharacterized protein (DUF4415 family)